MPTPLNPGPSSAPPPFDSEATKFSAANAFRRPLLGNSAYLNQGDAKSAANGFIEFFNMLAHFKADSAINFRQYGNLVATHQDELAGLSFA